MMDSLPAALRPDPAGAAGDSVVTETAVTEDLAAGGL